MGEKWLKIKLLPRTSLTLNAGKNRVQKILELFFEPFFPHVYFSDH